MAEDRISCTIADEALELFAERALYWPKRRALVVSDLHWGKTATFRRYGIAVPESILTDDLARLGALIAKTGAERIWVLGDLIHGKLGLTDGVVERIATWREAWPVELVLIRGNHDRWLKEFPPAWRVTIRDEAWEEGPFRFSHEPLLHPERFVWCGHVHPTVRFPSTIDPIRLPCFVIEGSLGILPAFSAFTGGQNILLKPGMMIYPVSAEEIFYFEA